METYYIITSNTCEVIEIGEFPGLLQAEYYASGIEDHLAHGEDYIVVSALMAEHIRNKLVNLNL